MATASYHRLVKCYRELVAKEPVENALATGARWNLVGKVQTAAFYPTLVNFDDHKINDSGEYLGLNTYSYAVFLTPNYPCTATFEVNFTSSLANL